ncbi:MAG: hypothetical protein COB04_09970 [Gammaproteobacteria bacterium]|nr:MAG: hypothetical protein COB04_09970 [Gammaproteobacteria bacterium]
MLVLKSKAIAYIMVIVMSGLFIFPAVSAAGNVDERPTAIEMGGDALLRPVLMLATAVGAGFFVVTLPFSLLGGNVVEAADTFVVAPFKSTFIRCLGCTAKNIGKKRN